MLADGQGMEKTTMMNRMFMLLITFNGGKNS